MVRIWVAEEANEGIEPIEGLPKELHEEVFHRFDMTLEKLYQKLHDLRRKIGELVWERKDKWDQIKIVVYHRKCWDFPKCDLEPIRYEMIPIGTIKNGAGPEDMLEKIYGCVFWNLSEPDDEEVGWKHRIESNRSYP